MCHALVFPLALRFSTVSLSLRLHIRHSLTAVNPAPVGIHVRLHVLTDGAAGFDGGHVPPQRRTCLLWYVERCTEEVLPLRRISTHLIDGPQFQTRSTRFIKHLQQCNTRQLLGSTLIVGCIAPAHIRMSAGIHNTPMRAINCRQRKGTSQLMGCDDVVAF